MTGTEKPVPERTPVEELAILRAVMEAMNTALSGRPADAIRALAADQRVLGHHGGLVALGSLYFQTGNVAEALAAFDRAIALKPDDAGAWCNRGAALQRLGRYDDALAAFETGISHAPSNVMAHFNRANLLCLARRYEEAEAGYARTVTLDPHLFDAHFNRGVAALQRNDAATALTCFEQALAIRPHAVEAFDARVAVLQRLGRRDEVLRLRRPTPEPAPIAGVEGAISRGRALIELGRWQEAIAVVSRIPAPGLPGARLAIVRAAALWKLDRFDEALAAGREAVNLDPDNASVREEFSYLCLKAGDFERGWGEYESRLDKPSARMRRADFRAPVWSGEGLAGRSIVVTPEQGHGDTLQFLRYLPMLVARGADVTACVQPPLIALARSMTAPVSWSAATDASEGAFDYQLPLLSLPHRFGTRLDSVPRDVPYLFADIEKVAAWRGRVGSEGFKVGIVWQGNPEYPSDPFRSVPLFQFAPLSAVPGVRLISLQAVHGLGQLTNLPAGMRVDELGPLISDNPDGMAEIAAAMASLDLVVASDTSIAHMAGALGRPVWVALNHDPDWRWLRDRSDSPWYPTMHLFRQAKPGDWAGVFAEIAANLAERVRVVPSLA